MNTEEEPLPPPAPERILEALLFVGGEPLGAPQACAVIRGLEPEQVGQLVALLNRAYRRENRPYRIRVRGAGYHLALTPRFRRVVERLYGSQREARLSQAALDVLSLVAFRQPVTQQEVENQRGADSRKPLQQLVRLGLVAIERPAPPQQEALYTTTPRFLRTFNLRTLDDLPQLPISPEDVR